MKKRDYRPCARFMERGGIYGRSPTYPWTAGRIRRVFRVIRCERYEKTFSQHRRWETINSRAFNTQPLCPLFAYEWRPKGWQVIPGGGGEYRETPIPVPLADDSSMMVMDFRIMLQKAA